MSEKLDAPRKITDRYIGNPGLHVLRKYNNDWADNFEFYHELPFIIFAVRLQSLTQFIEAAKSGQVFP